MAGAIFNLRLTKACIDRFKSDKGDQSIPSTILYSKNDTPDRSQAILKGLNEDDWSAHEAVKQHLTMGIETLKKSGVTHVIAPCNTAHVALREVIPNSGIQLIDMIRATTNHLTQYQRKRVGILGTPGLVKSNIYHHELSSNQIQALSPNPEEQAAVMAVIRQEKQGRVDHDTIRKWRDWLVGWQQENDLDAIVLGCTELPLILTHIDDSRPEWVDPQQLVINEAVDLMASWQSADR